MPLRLAARKCRARIRPRVLRRAPRGVVDPLLPLPLRAWQRGCSDQHRRPSRWAATLASTTPCPRAAASLSRTRPRTRLPKSRCADPPAVTVAAVAVGAARAAVGAARQTISVLSAWQWMSCARAWRCLPRPNGSRPRSPSRCSSTSLRTLSLTQRPATLALLLLALPLRPRRVAQAAAVSRRTRVACRPSPRTALRLAARPLSTTTVAMQARQLIWPRPTSWTAPFFACMRSRRCTR
mmetsp:Transcript_16780/g.58654  ORF Transcript_16780/g.58654 Transcript_16780/m.58654 type:complete len:238 (-) Transcript_16780:8437-9150(-)